MDLLSACPSCSCPDWFKFHLPCKHILAIFQHYPGWDWDFLSKEFRDAPHFNLDHDILEKENQISDATEVPDNVFPDTHTYRNKNMCKTKKLEVQEEATLPNIKEWNLCRELLKTIQSSLMNVCGQNIRTIYNQLQQVAETLKRIEPKEDNLPLLKTHKRKILGKKDQVKTSKSFHGNYIFFNSFCTKFQKLHIAPTPSNFSINSNLLIKMVTIVDFSAFLRCRLKLTLALKELMFINGPTCFIVYQLHIDVAFHCLNME